MMATAWAPETETICATRGDMLGWYNSHCAFGNEA